jgi:PucR C-terminal helix-turn-helix domain/GGDEF-like domain
MSPRPSTLPLMLTELVRIDPLASAADVQLANPNRRVEQVVLAETFDRLRSCAPHSLVVLHGAAATGGWSLAAALHIAWERNVSGVVVTQAVASTSNAALAKRLNMSLIIIDTDPIDVALALAGQISAPAAARALRLARCAEELAEQSGIRGVLGVLNSELGTTAVALVVGGAVLAGRAAAIQERPDVEIVSVAMNGPGERPWAQLVAAVPANASAGAQEVEALLRLARPSLLAAWAQTRLNSSTHAAHEAAAFSLLRRLATDGRTDASTIESTEIEAPPWSSELGWQVEGSNRAVWMAPLHTTGEPPEELTHLVRAAWQRGRPAWPLIAEGDGWISWQSGSEPDDAGPVRRALSSFRDSALAHGIAIGVGRAHEGVSGLMRSVTEARLAAHIARGRGPGAVQWFDQVGPSAVLAWLPLAEIAQVADLCLTDLMAARDRQSLADTVLAVLDCGGSLSEASQRLGVHRNTVLARVVRARNLGLVFDDPVQRLALHVLCYALASSPTP